MTPENGHTKANHLCLQSNMGNGPTSKLPPILMKIATVKLQTAFYFKQKKHVQFHLQNCHPLLIFRYDIIKCITTIEIYWVLSWSSRAFSQFVCSISKPNWIQVNIKYKSLWVLSAAVECHPTMLYHFQFFMWNGKAFSLSLPHFIEQQCEDLLSSLSFGCFWGVRKTK